MPKIMMRAGRGCVRPVLWSDANDEGLSDLLDLLSADDSVVLEFEDEEDVSEGEGWEDHHLTHPMSMDGGWLE